MTRLVVASALLLALVFGPLPAEAARELWPGVVFSQTVQLTVNGPVVMNVITGPRPGGTTTLEPMLSNDALGGRETLTAMERRLSPVATYAGVNGDFFNFQSGLPSGGLIQDGTVVATPNTTRSTVGVSADGTLDVRELSLSGSWRAAGPAHPLSLNRVPTVNGGSLFTPAWGPSTPTVSGSVALVLFPLTVPSPGIDAQATVQTLIAGAGSIAIPAGGAVLVTRGDEAANARAEAPVGAPVTVRFDLAPTWPGLVSGLGGGPQIVRNGQPVFRAGEGFTTSQIAPRDPRTAVGQLKDGRVVLVAVDGRQPAWSVGMTNFELALAMVRLGAVTAMALDSGGSTTMAFDGQLLNRPSDPVERPISTALAFAYTGVFVSEPLPVVSPNGDGVDDTQTLAYKLVRPSSVTLTLSAPDGSTPVTQAVDQQPGTYPVPFPPGGGTAPAEGTWKLDVAATDDLGRQTRMLRTFTVDDTLGFLSTSVPRLFLPPGGRDLAISWKQTRATRAVVTIETKAGTVVRTLARRRYDAGDQSVTWNGLDRSRKRVKGGVYRAHVTATSDLGTSELVRTFTVRQIAAPKS
jgi:hypothetical protein